MSASAIHGAGLSTVRAIAVEPAGLVQGDTVPNQVATSNSIPQFIPHTPFPLGGGGKAGAGGRGQWGRGGKRLLSICPPPYSGPGPTRNRQA